MRGWLVVALVGAVAMGMKALSPLALGGRPVPPALHPTLRRLAPALFGALVATQVFGSGRALALDARAGGLAVALVGAALRVPPIATLGGAIATTAALRHWAARRPRLAGAMAPECVSTTVTPARRTSLSLPGAPATTGRACRSIARPNP